MGEKEVELNSHQTYHDGCAGTPSPFRGGGAEPIALQSESESSFLQL